MYSPTHIKDAYDLGEILCNDNFINVSVIPAYHPMTMRVRINFESVADITFCPKNIYDHIPYLTYKNIRFVYKLFHKII